MLVSELQTELAYHLHDPNKAEAPDAVLLMFIQSAARDARSNGWLIRLEDNESLTVLANTWEYNVPASFAYINNLMTSETINSTTVYIDAVPREHYAIRYNGGSPVFSFASISRLPVGKTIKVIGQKRPTIYALASETVDVGMESFLRERALFFAFRYTGSGLSELARWRQQMSTVSWQMSEALLKRHPQEFRQLPSSIVVPGRE